MHTLNILLQHVDLPKLSPNYHEKLLRNSFFFYETQTVGIE